MTTSDDSSFDLSQTPAHLGRDPGIHVQPPFAGGMQWFADYAARTLADGASGRLVSIFAFGSWDEWEMHPMGGELVVCMTGEFTLLQEFDDGVHRTVLTAGRAAINPAGVWHTVDVADGGQASALFITAGQGTEHRPRTA